MKRTNTTVTEETVSLKERKTRKTKKEGESARVEVFAAFSPSARFLPLTGMRDDFEWSVA